MADDPTDDPVSDLEARLRRDLDAIAAAVPERVTVLPEAAEPRRRLAVGVAAALLAVAGLVVAALWWGGDTDTLEPVATTTTDSPSTTSTSPPTTTTETPVEAAPPSETGAYRLWLSTEAVSTAGSEMIFVVLGPPADLEWDSEVSVDAWDGEAWQPMASGGTCLDFEHCWGDLGAFGEQLTTRRAFRNFGVDDGGIGRAEYLRLEGLEPGWHRLRQTIGGEVAAGVFRVIEDDAMPTVAPLAPVEEDALLMEPVLAGPNGAVLTMTPAIAAPRNELGELAPTTRLESWTGTDWVGVLDFDTTGVTAALGIPPLPPGAYRVVRTRTPGADLIGNLWVVDGVTNAADCLGLPSLAELLGTDADDFDGPKPPTVELRPAWTSGGFRVQWDAPDTTITYSYPVGGVIDLVGERVVEDGPVLLWYQGGFGTPSTIEVWVQLPECAEGFANAAFTVTGGSEEENVALALRLGRALAARYNPAFAVAPRTDCPDESTPAPATPNAVHDVWMWCRTDPTAEAALVPVKSIFSPDDPITTVIRRGLGQPWNGLETMVPVELWAARKDITIDRAGVLRIDIDYDFAAAPIENFSTSNWSGRYLAQLAANAFQFAEVTAIDLDTLCCADWAGLYTREQWERAQADE